MVRRAIERILARLSSEKFNSLEIVRVAYVASERFLGVRNATVSAQSRHIQGSLFFDLLLEETMKRQPGTGATEELENISPLISI